MFDRLIIAGSLPVTRGVFVVSGRIKVPDKNTLDRFDRSYEYDGPGNTYDRSLLTKLLPEVET